MDLMSRTERLEKQVAELEEKVLLLEETVNVDQELADAIGTQIREEREQEAIC